MSEILSLFFSSSCHEISHAVFSSHAATTLKFFKFLESISDPPPPPVSYLDRNLSHGVFYKYYIYDPKQ